MKAPMLGVLSLVLGLMTVTTVGCAASPNDDTADQSSEVRRSTDAKARAAIEKAAEGAIYVSETDAPYTWVDAKLDRVPAALTEALVIEKLGHLIDNPDNATIHAKAASFDDFFRFDCSEDEFPGPEECAKDKILHDALKANLKKLKVFYVAPYENPGGDGVPTIFLLGITPEGNLGGVSTMAVWT
jgi:hypothetical protein